MTEATSDAFLSGEGVPVPLRDVDAELARLWGPAAEREGGPDLERPTVTRLALANLVLADLESDGAHTRAILEGVTRHFPSRTIILRRSGRDDRELTAEVAALCHLPAPGMPQVCAERIILRAGEAALDLIPGAVRPLLEADLPLVLWWAGDPLPTATLFRDLADESARLILDLPDPGTNPEALRFALDLQVNAFGRDQAWFGITLWRERLAHFFDAPGAAAALDRIERVRIEVAVPPGAVGTPRVALWLAAWLAGQLGWSHRARIAIGHTLYGAVFNGPAGGLAIEFETVTRDGLDLPVVIAARLEAGDAGTFEARRLNGGAEVRIQAEVPGQPAFPRLVRGPEWSAAHRIAAALESARDDPPYRAALPHLLWMLGG